MPETEDYDFYEVEHEEGYVLTPDQTRRLIWQKFERNGVLLDEYKERESRLNAS